MSKQIADIEDPENETAPSDTFAWWLGPVIVIYTCTSKCNPAMRLPLGKGHSFALLKVKDIFLTMMC